MACGTGFNSNHSHLIAHHNHRLSSSSSSSSTNCNHIVFSMYACAAMYIYTKPLIVTIKMCKFIKLIMLNVWAENRFLFPSNEYTNTCLFHLYFLSNVLATTCLCVCLFLFFSCASKIVELIVAKQGLRFWFLINPLPFC